VIVRRMMAAIAVAVMACSGAPGAGPARHDQDAPRPLPDQKTFLAEAARRLRSNDLLLSQYVFTQTETRLSRDSGGRVTRTEVKVYEVYPAPDRELTYRRLMLENGSRPSDLAEKDREQAQKVRKWIAARQREGESARQARARKDAEAQRHEREVVEDILALYSVTMIGREATNARPAILFTLDPRPGYKARTDEAAIIRKFKGRAWIDEQDYELARLEMEAVDTVSIGLGIVARLNTGFRARIDRQKIDNEVWLPTRTHFAGTGRILLLKRIDLDQVSEYTGYRRLTAESTTTFTIPK
jgi:hypothetical protein